MAASVVDTAGRWRVLGAVVAGLAVAVAVPALRSEPDAAAAPVVTTYDRTPAGAHSYALRATCRRDGCAVDLLSTDRPARTVPRLGAAPGAAGRLVVLGPDEVVVDWAPPGRPREVRRVHSVDGGRTWGWVTARVRGAVREIPADGALATACVAGRTPCEHREVVVIQACSGTSDRLATAPRLDGPVVRRRPGGWQVTGREPGSHRWTTAVSTDGRVWTMTPAPTR